MKIKKGLKALSMATQQVTSTSAPLRKSEVPEAEHHWEGQQRHEGGEDPSLEFSL